MPSSLYKQLIAKHQIPSKSQRFKYGARLAKSIILGCSLFIFKQNNLATGIQSHPAFNGISLNNIEYSFKRTRIGKNSYHIMFYFFLKTKGFNKSAKFENFSFGGFSISDIIPFLNLSSFISFKILINSSLLSIYSIPLKFL